MTLAARSGGKRWWERLRRNVYVHLVEPFLETHDPLPQVSWGATVGMFVGLTPTVGIQMYIVTLLYLLCRYGFRARFNLTIAISLVWISNPVTMIPIYFVFLQVGDALLGYLGHPVSEMTFELFQAEVALLAEGQQDWTTWLLAAGQVFLLEFGWPIVVGSLVFAVPGALLAYPVTYFMLSKYRRFLARSYGITYAEWRRRYEARE